MASLRDRLTGKVTIGTWLAVGSSQTAEIMGQVGFDWVILDTQHGGMSEPDLLPILQALKSTGTPTLVRHLWRSENADPTKKIILVSCQGRDSTGINEAS